LAIETPLIITSFLIKLLFCEFSKTKSSVFKNQNLVNLGHFFDEKSITCMGQNQFFSSQNLTKFCQFKKKGGGELFILVGKKEKINK
jgi:hypothetical protein